MTSSIWRSGHHAAGGFSQYWREWQPQAVRGLPVLALHGSLTQSGMWCAPAEAAGTIAMLCPDQRGFGLSEDPGTDACAAFAADAVALAAARLPERFVVLAHSFACSIALDVARLAAGRIAGVVLVDPVVRIGPPGPAPAQPPASPPPESFATLELAAQHFRDTEEGTWPEAALRRFVADIMIRDGDDGPWRFPYTAARLRRLRAFTASADSDFDLLTKAKAVTCPLLVFRGGASKRFPAAAEEPFLAAFASKPELVVCPGSGHFPSTTEPEIVVPALQRFVAGLD